MSSSSPPGIVAAVSTSAAAAAAEAAAAVATPRTTRTTRRAAAPRAVAVPPPNDARLVETIARAIGILGGRPRAVGVAGWASALGLSPASSSRSLSFLSDPKLSIEEKLMRLLAHLNEKWEKEMQAKMNQIAGNEGDTAGGAKKTTRKKKSGGLLGGIAGALSSVPALGGLLGALKIPGVSAVLGKIGGPVLAAAAGALGFPAAAPLLLKYGPALLEAASGVANAMGSEAASGSGAMSDGKRQQLVMEIQRLYEKQKEMFGLVSNILRTSHETRMIAVNNVR